MAPWILSPSTEVGLPCSTVAYPQWRRQNFPECSQASLTSESSHMHIPPPAPSFITLDSEMQAAAYERPSVLSTEAWGSAGDLRHWGSESTQVETRRPYFTRLAYHARSPATCWVMTSERVAFEPGALLRKVDTTHRATTPGRPRAQTGLGGRPAGQPPRRADTRQPRTQEERERRGDGTFAEVTGHTGHSRDLLGCRTYPFPFPRV